MSNLSHTIVIGNSTDISICPNASTSEMRVDVLVSEFTSVRLWGQIIDTLHQPVSGALVKLVKVIHCDGEKYYEETAHTVSDCDGFYQFDLCSTDTCYYKVLVDKHTTSTKVVVNAANLDCPAFTPHYGLYSPR